MLIIFFFRDAQDVHLLAFSTVMLNTDAHNPNVSGQRMNVNDFVGNLEMAFLPPRKNVLFFFLFIFYLVFFLFFFRFSPNIFLKIFTGKLLKKKSHFKKQNEI